MPGNEHPLFDSVDALLAAVESGEVLPAPDERVRLRRAAGLSEAAVAQALKVRPASVQAWEAGRSEPTGDKREAYKRLLDGLAAKFPTAPAQPSQTAAPQSAAAPTPGAEATAERTAPTPPPPLIAPVVAAVAPVMPPPAPVPGPTPAPRRAAKATSKPSTTTAPAAAAGGGDGRFANGPLLVLDGDGQAYGIDGLVLDCPPTTVPALVKWTLEHGRIGAPRLHRSGKDADPLVVLTAAAAERLGLPPTLEDTRGLRLPENHKVVKAVLRAQWKLTQRGFGPWPRIYRPIEGGRRLCVQLAVLPWKALDPRDWGKDFAAQAAAGTVHPAQIAQVLGGYASLVTTPRGGGATCGIALMEELRPPTHAVKTTRYDEESGEEVTGWERAALPGSLPIAVDAAVVEAPEEHPLVVALYPKGHKRSPAEEIDEEAYEWIRDPEQLTDAECEVKFAVGIDVNMAFAAAANRLTVGLGEVVHVVRPTFHKKIPGDWLYDLSAIPLDPRLPSPFTPDGSTPTGAAWYATPTIAYAHELIDTLRLDIQLTAIEGLLHPNMKQLAWLGVAVPPAPWERGDPEQLERLGLGELTPKMLQFLHTVPRFDNGPYLDPWYQHLRDAYLATMAHLGVTPDMEPAAFLQAMEHHKSVDQAQAVLLSAIKATVKGGVGKLKERPRHKGYVHGQPWPALRRPTWRPDIRAAVISTARVGMHRKMLNLALKADLYPIAVLSDCAVYPSAGPSPLDFLPYTADGKPLPGGFRLGVSPGMVKHEGTQSFLWAAQLLDQGHNPARHIKGTDAADGGE